MCLGPITKHGDIDYEAVVKLSDGFNGADLRNVCTEAGLFAIRSYTDRQRDRVLVLPDSAGSAIFYRNFFRNEIFSSL